MPGKTKLRARAGIIGAPTCPFLRSEVDHAEERGNHAQSVYLRCKSCTIRLEVPHFLLKSCRGHLKRRKIWICIRFGDGDNGLTAGEDCRCSPQEWVSLCHVPQMSPNKVLRPACAQISRHCALLTCLNSARVPPKNQLLLRLLRHTLVWCICCTSAWLRSLAAFTLLRNTEISVSRSA